MHRVPLFALVLHLALHATSAAAQAPLGCPSDFELEVLELTNQARAAGTVCNGVFKPPAPPLALDVRLMEAAQLHSDDMSGNDFMSHTGTGETNPGQRISAAGYEWWGWAENVAAGQMTPVEVVNAWIASTSGHCEALMDPDYEHLGVGYASSLSSTYVHYWTQNFATPSWAESILGPETECPECSDGMDNDGDGRVDHPEDLQCISGSDEGEAGGGRPSCGLGPEFAGILFLLGSLREGISRRRNSCP